MSSNLPIRLTPQELRAASRAGYLPVAQPTAKKEGFFGGMWSFFPSFSSRIPTFWPAAGQSRGPVNAAHATSGETVTPASALTLSAAWACTWLISRTIATIPLDLKRQGVSGRLALAIDTDLYDILRWSPNDRMTASDFWQCMLASLQLWGNAYARKLKRVNGTLVGLDPMRPEWMTVILKDGRIVYRYDDPNEPREFTADEIWHLKDHTIDGLVGASVIEFARNSLGLAQSGETAAGKTFKNGMQASGFIIADTFLKKEQRESVRQSLAEFGAGGEKTGGTMILEGPFKDYKQLSLKPLDAELLASREFSVEDVCRWWGVPPVMIGHSSNVTMWGSGLEQMVGGFTKFTLQPLLTVVQQGVRRSLLSPSERKSLIATYDLDALLAADSAAMASLLSSLTQNGLLTRNEGREKMNLAPMDGGDELTVQSNLLPLDGLGGQQQGTPSDELAKSLSNFVRAVQAAEEKNP